MKKESRLIKAFGERSFGFADVPKKVSGTQISRIMMGEEMGCSYCFPHGLETVNSHDCKYQRNWKKYRRTKWKSS